MSFAARWTLRQRFGFCTFIALCSFGAYFMYNNMSITFNSDRFKATHKQEVSANIQGNDKRVHTPVTEEPKKQEIMNVKDGHTDPDTILLIWMWPSGQQFEMDCSKFDMKGCRITDDKTLYSKAHVVLFHHVDIQSDLSNMPKEPRPWFQKWVWWNRESPAISHPIPGANNLFNMTLNYRIDSTVPARYGILSQRTHVEDDFKIPAKDKLVCWIVSHWDATFERVKYYDELKKHIQIDTYGNSFGKRIGDEEQTRIITSCKFYLSFENSIYKDYITEKLYNPMRMGTVPIVLGPPRQNYEEHIPGNSFIHVKDFDTPKLLADKLRYLDQNQSEYMNYFTWRRDFKAIGSRGYSFDICHVYNYLKHAPGYQVIEDVNKWYWG